MKKLVLLFVIIILFTGCGQDRVNLYNNFKKSPCACNKNIKRAEHVV